MCNVYIHICILLIILISMVNVKVFFFTYFLTLKCCLGWMYSFFRWELRLNFGYSPKCLYMCFRRRSGLCEFLIISNLARLHTNEKLSFYTYFLFVLSPLKNLLCNTKNTIKSSEKFFFVCAKATNCRKWWSAKNAETTERKSTISKELLIIKVHFFFSFRLLGRYDGGGGGGKWSSLVEFINHTRGGKSGLPVQK